MGKLWRRIQYRVFSNHRWQEKRFDGEKVFVCRDCRKRYFGSEPPEGDLGAFGGGGGGPGGF